jgi:DNA replication protein DnaC
MAPTVITSQCPIKNWHHIIGEPTVADAILDRFLHHCYKLKPQRRVDQKE